MTRTLKILLPFVVVAAGAVNGPPGSVDRYTLKWLRSSALFTSQSRMTAMEFAMKEVSTVGSGGGVVSPTACGTAEARLEKAESSPLVTDVTA